MVAKIDGTTGIDLIQDGAVSTAAKLGSQVVTPPKLSGGQSGNAPLFGARAWCVFNGTLTGTNAPIAGGNVASVTRNAAGDYTVNFTTAMQDANYAVIGMAQDASGGASVIEFHLTVAPTPSAVRIYNRNSGTGIADNALISIVIFR